MACAGRGRGRGLLQSVMTEGNKQLQLGHSGSCCGALSLCWCCCCMHFGAETNDGPEASNGCRKPTKQTMNDNNRRRRRCLQLLPELLPCCCAWQGVVYFFFFFGLLVWTKHRYTSANWSLSAAPAALPVAALHWSSSSGSFNTLT